MRNCLIIFLFALLPSVGNAANPYDNPDTLVVARDGTGQFRNIAEAIEVCRAFMDYHKVIFVKKGTYKEKLIIPQSLTNIEICGEDRDNTIITWDDHANIIYPPTGKPMGTFRTYTLKIEGADITLKNITVENNAARLGQAVALFTTGDKIVFLNCRLWDIRTPSILVMPAHVITSRTAISKERPTSSSVLLPHGLRTVTSSARQTPISRQPLPLRM